MYEIAQSDVALTQADIIDQCPLFSLDTDSATLSSEPKRHDNRVIVLTQACDLAQSKTDRAQVAVIHQAQYLVNRKVIKASLIRDQVRRGLVFGLYFLPSANEPLEFPESIVDLRDLHTIPIKILKELIANGKRVCTSASPWREHLAQHFGVT